MGQATVRCACAFFLGAFLLQTIRSCRSLTELRKLGADLQLVLLASFIRSRTRAQGLRLALPGCVCPRGMQGLFPPRRGRQSEACGGDHCHVHPHRFRTASGLFLCPRSSSCPCNPRATYTGVVFSRLCYCSVQSLWSKYYNILQRATTRRNITQHVAACYNSIAIVIGGVLFRRGG